MYSMGFIETFIEVFNAGSAVILIFLIGQILFIMRRVDRDLLKARLFLNDAVMQKTWTYLSVAGAGFALNALVKLMVLFTTAEGAFDVNYLVDMTQLIFLTSFVMAVYNWYVFVSGSDNQKNNLKSKHIQQASQ